MYDILRHEWTRFLVLGVTVLGIYACAAQVDKPAQERVKITSPPDETVVHPAIPEPVTLRAHEVDGTSPEWQPDADITIRGVTKQLRTPMTLEKARERIVASGTLQILQSDFGITPFSVLAGALQVKDEVKLQYRFVARYAE